MDIPVSLVGNGPISLPLKHEAPIHVQITIPFSLLVKDFDPNTTQVPHLERPRSWLANRLFGRRYTFPTDAPTKAFLVASPVFESQVWPKLGASLFGKMERIGIMYSHATSDAEKWERAGASNLFWAFSTGVTDEDISNVRAVVLKASPGPAGAGGILFTVEEMDEREKAAWKSAWEVLGPFTPSPPWRDGESDVDLAMERKNNALCRLKAGWVTFPRPSNEKESSEKESSESV
ncbi:hypothetical protein B0I37DRAFT_366605 [Chaetomium sp. MPI-CAGE-AT-0009]|nr:hypothetical protein B0I37DRAFT_366605 [Chaetomium sp. MPI-CAGE-AT-0009]